MNVKAVLFDFDGTLIDTSDLIFRSFEYALDTVMGKQIPREELLWTFGRPLAKIMDTLGGEHAEALMHAFKVYSVAHEQEITLFAGVTETLAYLHKHNIKTAIVTSRVYASAMRDLELVGLSGQFDLIISPESTKEHKPHPAPAQKAMELLGVTPETTIMIGDSTHDLLCGAQAGCATGFVRYSLVTQQELLACSPNYGLDTLTDLIPIIEQNRTTNL